MVPGLSSISIARRIFRSAAKLVESSIAARLWLLFAVSLLMACAVPASSHAQMGYGCERDKNRILYRFSSGSPDWVVGNYGYHAAALIYCKKCDPAHNAAGFLRLGPSDGRHMDPDIERAREGLSELSSYMYSPFDKVEPRGNPTSVRFGGFVGWQTKFDAMKRVAEEIRRHDIIVVDAQDGCAAIRIRIEASASGKDDPIDAVKKLIAAIRITKEDMPIVVKAPEPYPEPKLDFGQFQHWLGTKR